MQVHANGVAEHGQPCNIRRAILSLRSSGYTTVFLPSVLAQTSSRNVMLTGREKERSHGVMKENVYVNDAKAKQDAMSDKESCALR